MRIAAIYDIHGNLPALEAVLQEIKQASVEHIVVGGDVVAGPMPVTCLELLQNTGIPTQFIHGNAESELLRHLAGQPVDGLSPAAETIAKWVSGILPTEQQQLISGWPTTIQHEIEGIGTVIFCHATPHNDIDVFTTRSSDERLHGLFDSISASLVICGHTHMQFDRTFGDLRIVNAGSVGMPFGSTGAYWLLIDNEITFKHTDYNRQEAAERISKTDYPNAKSFANNNVLQTPSEEQASALLAKLESQQSSSN